MKTHIIKFRAVDKVNFDTIVDGRKTVETRAATVRYQNYAAGDILLIKCGADEVQKPIKKIATFPGIEALVSEVGLKNVMPLCNSPEEAEKIWYSFPGYKEKIQKHGLIAFYI